MNSFVSINPSLVDVIFDEHDGYPDHLAAEDTRDNLMAAAGDSVRDFPAALWYEPRDWPEIARENDKNKTWAINYIDRYTNQDPTHECTCHSLTRCMECARNRQRGIIFPEGPKKGFRYPESAAGSVWISPLSVYNEANPRQWGGANVRQVMEIACRRGALPDKIQPRDYAFKHTLQGTTGRGNNNQSTGPWVSVKEMPEGWEDTAAWLKPLEVIFPESWEQEICLNLHGLLVGVGRNGHAVPRGAQLIFKGDNLDASAYPDSYDITRYDSLSLIKKSWQGSFCIVTMSAADDWLKPAG